MTPLFNTTLEISTRELLVLYASPRTPRTLYEVTAIDYLSCYAKSFGIGSVNLHGDGEFNFGEFADRRSAAEKASEYLVTHNLVTPHTGTDGFTFTITTEGRKLCDRLTSEYASDFQDALAKTFTLIDANPGLNVVNFVNHAGNLAVAKDDQ